ncbi:hypothetical protein [uncultured Cohaesibacter sp.]|uniref:hypothetical protein n=1 Tax=uncultured Cohaesibacter sp. TaxID=1002546 RepID=UPI0029C8F7CC|nr:hypothetical protein [uncultured Cohaesibacter sp.]
MSTKLTIALMSSMIALAVASEANAWTRNGTVTGPRGTSSVQASGSCANGACSRQVTRTNPYGQTSTRSGSAACANGVCSGSSTTTGPYGGTVTRQGTISR